MDGTMSPEEAAEFLRVNPQTIYRALRRGRLPGAKIGHQWRIRREDLDAYLQGPSGAGRQELLDAPELLSIHRHWLWANRVRKQFYEDLGQWDHTAEDARGLGFIREAPGMWMCLWYAVLYAVCEALARRNVLEEAGPQLAPIMDELRRFRNAVDHVQSDYASVKLVEIMRVPGSVDRINEGHASIGTWLLAELRAGSEDPPAVGMGEAPAVRADAR